MKISLATNYEDDFIEKIKGYEVYEIYGKLKDDCFCGGRPNNNIKDVTREKFERHVALARNAGINFNYLLNGACTANKEQNKQWKDNFIRFILYLKSIGVNAFTITNPFILRLVKNIFPQSICRVSTFACVDSLEKALYWENIGADIICVDFTTVNRNFYILRSMVQGLKKSKIELLVTNSCIKNCPYIHTHVNCIAHASDNNNSDDYIDWCLFECQYKELTNLEEYIKSPWIRPEDIKYYEDIGIEHFKITERDFPTDALLKRLNAYHNRSYDGNLLDLIQGHGVMLDGTQPQKIVKKTSFNKIQDVIEEIFRVRGFKQERKFPLHCNIDNRKLDGFIEHFIKFGCSNNCSSCSYCKKIAQNVITIDKETRDYLIFLYQQYQKFLFNFKNV